MLEKINEFKRLKDLYISEIETEKNVNLEDVERIQAWEAQNLKDKIEAGMVDPEKLSKYIEILSGRSKGPSAKAPADIDKEVLKKIELEFQEDVLKYRFNSMYADTGPGGWGCYLKKPIGSWGSSPGESYANDKNVSIVNGSYADLVAFAKGDTKYKVNDKGKNEIEVVSKSGEAWAIFSFMIPPSCLPKYGGRIRVYPVWHLFGEYWFVCNTWNLYKDYKAELEFSVATYAVTLGGKSEVKKVLLKKDPNPIGLFECEWDKILKYVGYPGPAAELNVIPGEDVYVFAKVHLICQAGGDLGAIWGNYAKLDFSQYNNHVEIEELRVETIKSNPPPITVYLKDYDKPKTFADSFPGTANPDLIKPKN